MHRFLLFVASTICWVGSFAGLASAVWAINPPADPSSKDARELLRAGLFEEEANRDLTKAAADYAAVVEQYDAGRTVAATAIFRLAEIRAKQGNKAEAIALYGRVLAEFPGDDALVKPSRERLAALGAPVPGVPGVMAILANPPALTSEEIEKLARTYKLVQAGSVPVPAITTEESDDLVRLRELVKDSPDLLDAVASDGSPSAGYTPLAYAADRGWTQAATFLLDHGAKPNGPTSGGEPLHLAAANGHKALVELLLAKGADINAATPDGWTALHAACLLRRTEISRLLLDKKADANVIFHQVPANSNFNLHGWGLPASDDPSPPAATPLLIAIQHEDGALANLLLDHGANPNLYAESAPGVQGVFTDDSSPLIVALNGGQEALARRLLAAGAKADFVTKGGWTPLAAAARSLPEMVPSLLDLGVPQVPDKDGKPPLFWSIYTFANWRDERAFVNPDSLLSLPDFAGKYAAYLTAWNALLAHGADLNARDKDGRTVFFSAVPDQGNHPVQLAEWLLAHGADPNARDHEQQTPLHVVCRGNATSNVAQTITWLAEHGADVNAQDEHRYTPLHLLCGYAQNDWNALQAGVAALCQRGANPALPDERGTVPFQAIQDTDHQRVLYRQYYYPHVIPSLTGDHAVNAFFSFPKNRQPRNQPSMSRRFVPAADFDAPPPLLDLIWQAMHVPEGDVYVSLPLVVTISVHRATAAGPDTEIARLTAGPDPAALDTSGWPALRWGDVVVFSSDTTSNLFPLWFIASTVPLRRTVHLRFGDRTSALTLADPAADNKAAAKQPLHNQNEVLTWSPALSPLPDWTLSELLLHLTDTEPRARLDAVRIERVVDGKTRSWTADLRAADPADALPGVDGQPSRVKKSAARLADGDRLTIPLLPADDAAALAARRDFVGFAAPGRTFAEQVFTRRRSDPGVPTLVGVLTQAYLGAMIIPYPDLSRVSIHRLKGDGGEEEAVPVDLTRAVDRLPGLQSVAASKGLAISDAELRELDVPLQWGDVVEVATIDGTDPKRWERLGESTGHFLEAVGARPVSVWVDGVARKPRVLLELPDIGSFRFDADPPAAYPGFICGDHQYKDDRVTADSLLLLGLGLDPKNVSSCVIQVGDQKRGFNAAQLAEINPRLSAGSEVRIQLFSP